MCVCTSIARGGCERRKEASSPSSSGAAAGDADDDGRATGSRRRRSKGAGSSRQTTDDLGRRNEGSMVLLLNVERVGNGGRSFVKLNRWRAAVDCQDTGVDMWICKIAEPLLAFVEVRSFGLLLIWMTPRVKRPRSTSIWAPQKSPGGPYHARATCGGDFGGDEPARRPPPF